MKSELSLSEWKSAEVVVSPHETFTLWLIHDGLCQDLTDFKTHFGDELDPAVSKLEQDGFIIQENRGLLLTEAGERIISYLTDFSGADIRGFKFTGANLAGANFSSARAGVRKRWMVLPLCICISFVLCSVLDFVGILFAVVFTTFLLPPNFPQDTGIFPYIEMSVIQLGIYVIFARQGFTAKPLRITAFVAVVIAVAFALALVLIGAVPVAVGVVGAAAVAGVVAVAFAGALALALAPALALAGAVTSAGVFVLAFALADALAFAFAPAFAPADALARAIAGAVDSTGALARARTVAGAIALAALLLSLYVARRSSKEDEKFELARSLGLWLGVLGGTSFKTADLSDADFSDATLSNCNFSGATVTRTRFKGAKQLKRARLRDTILNDTALRDLLVTGQGQGQNYRSKKLQGVNLAKADLHGADFTEADLSGAILAGADLTGANLTKALALGADFSGANLTGATLEAWNIDSTTQLDGVICNYVYLLNGQRERRPSSGAFGSGEFTKLFQEALDTVDFIFRNGIDWRAFIIAFKKLQAENPGTKLTVQSIESKGDGVVVVRVSVPPGANKEKLHSEFTPNYEMNLKLLEAELKAKDKQHEAELEAKDRHISIVRELYREQVDAMLTVFTSLPSRPINIGGTIIDIGGTRMRDIYNVRQAGVVVGSGAHAHGINFNQVWNDSSIDIAQLAGELKELRDSLSKEASERDHYVAFAEVVLAEKAAEEGNGPKALEHLKKAGSWVWDVATKIGTGVATAAAKIALGV